MQFLHVQIGYTNLHIRFTSSNPSQTPSRSKRAFVTNGLNKSATLSAMTPNAMAEYLENIVAHKLRMAVMLWGPPGVGKSSIVAQIADKHNFGFVDLRLSQLAPTDLRGLPVAQEGLSRWFPPEFLPTSGEGILFLDEINMAPPTMQGMAQQLILDRRVGSYELPDGWFVWAAGNRKEDRASVFDMPAPLANRFLHLEIEPDLEAFKHYAFHAGLHERILAFLAFRPQLLHALDTKHPAWPSPRSWEMASHLLKANLDIAPVVGVGAATEFASFTEIYAALPELEQILSGTLKPGFPEEPSARYAVTMGLCLRAETAERARNAFKWMVDAATPEWVQLFATDVVGRMRLHGEKGALAKLLRDEPRMQEFLPNYKTLVGMG